MFYSFQIKRLPKSEHETVKQLVKEMNIVELTYIHNKYKVSDNHFCCPDPCVLIHFKDMFDNAEQ